ncbi:MAG: PAS domain-containing protein [Pseudomonadota bacterium]
MPFFQESHDDDPSFLTLAHRAPVMIWMSGLDLGCFYFNRAWLSFRGRLLAQEYGNGWAEGVHPDDLERCVEHYTTCFRERVPFVMSYRLQHFSGEYHWILDRGTPHYSPDGQFLGYFGGCAETEAIAPGILNVQLRTSLAGVAAFARDLAEAQLESPGAGAARSSLTAFAQTLRLAQGDRAREMKHAAAELEKLTTDMLAYGDLPNGACLR